MIRTPKRLRLCVTLLIMNLVFIWGNSLLPGELSGALSHWLKGVLEAVFGSSGGDSSQTHGLLRKLAHFTEFGCLGMCLGWLFSMLSKPKWLSLLCGFLAACVDETIQCFVPDRGPGIKDVMIDTAGVAVGMAVLLFGYTIYKNKNQNNFWRKQNDEKTDRHASGPDHGCEPVGRLRQRRGLRQDPPDRHHGREC